MKDLRYFGGQMATRVVAPNPAFYRVCVCVLFTAQPLNFPFIAISPSLPVVIVGKLITFQIVIGIQRKIFFKKFWEITHLR